MNGTERSLQRLTKWRRFFASWQLGTTRQDDGTYKAVSDHRELTIILRCEVNALTGLLIRKGVFTAKEFDDALREEADKLSADYARRFPGWKATDAGLEMRMPGAMETMHRLGFPP